jgi:hypothetical protein
MRRKHDPISVSVHSIRENEPSPAYLALWRRLLASVPTPPPDDADDANDTPAPPAPTRSPHLDPIPNPAQLAAYRWLLHRLFSDDPTPPPVAPSREKE